MLSKNLVWAESCRGLPCKKHLVCSPKGPKQSKYISKDFKNLLFSHVSSCFLKPNFDYLWLGLLDYVGFKASTSWSRLLSITNWGTDCVVRMLLQKQVDLGRDIPIRRNTCRSSSRTFILKTLINVEICCESNEEVKKCKKSIEKNKQFQHGDTEVPWAPNSIEGPFIWQQHRKEHLEFCASESAH